MTETNGIPPIPDPVVEIDGRKLTVRFDFYAEYKCSESGLELASLKNSLFNVITLWTACVANNYAGAAETVPTALQWVERIGDDVPLRLKIYEAVGIAMSNFTRRRMITAADPAQAVEIPAPSQPAVN